MEESIQISPMSRLSSEKLSNDSETDTKGLEPQVLDPTNEVKTSFDTLYDRQSENSLPKIQTVEPLNDNSGRVELPELSVNVNTVPPLTVVVESIGNLPIINEVVRSSVNVANEQFQQNVASNNTRVESTKPSTSPKTVTDQTKINKRKQAQKKLAKLEIPKEKEESQNSDEYALQVFIGPKTFWYKGQNVSIDVNQLPKSPRGTSGGFGCVCPVVIEGPPLIEMAVKIPFTTTDVINEITTMELVASEGCPYIVDYYCTLYDSAKKRIYICMELMNVSIEEFYKTMHSLEVLPCSMVDTLVRRIAHNIVVALRYLSWKLMVHRDIKPANMLINKDVEIKLCDFGISRTFDEMKLKSERIVGTANYLPPTLEHTIKDDMWALGITLLEFICNGNPFENKDSYGKELAIYMWKPSVPTIVSKEVQELILHLLKKEAKERPSSYDEILSTPAICDVSSTPSNMEFAFVHNILEETVRRKSITN